MLPRIYHPRNYVLATTAEEVCYILSTEGEKSRIVAGNVTLNELSKRGLLSSVETLVDISLLGLDYVKLENNALRIGSMTSIASLTDSEPISGSLAFRSIRQAVTQVLPLQVRNAGTVGGSICTGLPFLDLPIALMVVDSDVRLLGKEGFHTVSLAEFHKGILSSTTPQFLIEVVVPYDGTNQITRITGFQKFGVTGLDEAILNIAASVTFHEAFQIQNARLLAGGRGMDIVELTEASQFLADERLSLEASVKAGDIAADVLDPPTDLRGTSKFKKRIAKVLVQRVLEDILNTARKEKMKS